MSAWLIGVLALVLVPLALLGTAYVVVPQALDMGDVVANQDDYKITKIDNRENRLDLQFRSDSVAVTGRCGRWIAPMELNLWLRQVYFGSFEQTPEDTFACSPEAQAATSDILEALSTVRSWQLYSGGERIELRGDHTLRLLDE